MKDSKELENDGFVFKDKFQYMVRFAHHLNSSWDFIDNTTKGDIYQHNQTGEKLTDKEIYNNWIKKEFKT